MRRLTIPAALVALAMQAGAPAAEPGEPYWTPDAALIAKLEASVKIRGFPGARQYELAQYDRYYAGVTYNGQRQVTGRLIIPPNREDNPATGIHVTDEKYLPNLHGYGCANVHVTYYVESNQSYAQCTAPNASVPRSEQPHWIPDEATAARMDAAIREALRRGAPALDLDTYGRYYWGVTVNGKPVIRGRVLRRDPRFTTGVNAPGVHVAADWDSGPILSDGGCSNIRAVYDASAAMLTVLACDAALAGIDGLGLF